MAAATTRSGRKLPSIRTLWAIAKSPELGLTDEDLPTGSCTGRQAKGA